MPLVIGEHSYIFQYTNEFNIPISVGRYCSLANGLVIIGSEHPMLVSTFAFKECWNVDFPTCISRPIVIGNDVWFGSNVSIREGVHVGDGAIIGACSVVTKDVEPYSVMVGNPAVCKKYRFSPEIVKEFLEIKWWDWPYELVVQRIQDFKDIDVFIKKYSKKETGLCA
jgi:virginiamycin A acetyltransferase